MATGPFSIPISIVAGLGKFSASQGQRTGIRGHELPAHRPEAGLVWRTRPLARPPLFS